MFRLRIAHLVLWTLLAAQLQALPLARWLGHGCAMGCRDEGRVCCCELFDRAAVWPPDAGGAGTPRWARPVASCAGGPCATLAAGSTTTLSLLPSGAAAGAPEPTRSLGQLPPARPKTAERNPSTRPRSPPPPLLLG